MRFMDRVENNVYEITSEFAIRIVKLYKYLTDEKHEYIMSKQLFRSGTSIGANTFEGKNAQSRADFCNKMNIALKEATESGFWIDLLHKTDYMDDVLFESFYKDWNRIMGVLNKIVKATKNEQPTQ